jgi:GNAT superfamily N-acetyltransferase
VIRIRDAVDADADQVAAVHVSSWKGAYRGMLPDEYLDALKPEDRVEWWRSRLADPGQGHLILVAEDTGGVVRGLASIAPHDHLGDDWAVLPQIYLEPGAWGQGIGRALMAEALRRAHEIGYRHVELWVHLENVRARRFYEAGGWTSDGSEQTETVWGVEVSELRYTRSTAS